jgi:hypothetical protein
LISREFSAGLEEERLLLHRFAIGQSVQLVTNAGLARKVADSCRMTRYLPERDGSPQYRLLSQDGQHARVASEDAIEPAGSHEREVATAQSGKG